MEGPGSEQESLLGIIYSSSVSVGFSWLSL